MKETILEIKMDSELKERPDVFQGDELVRQGMIGVFIGTRREYGGE